MNEHSESQGDGSAVHSPARRRWLQGIATFGGGALLGGLGSYAWSRSREQEAAPEKQRTAYTGAHQAGVTTAGTQEAVFIAFARVE